MAGGQASPAYVFTSYIIPSIVYRSPTTTWAVPCVEIVHRHEREARQGKARGDPPP